MYGLYSKIINYFEICFLLFETWRTGIGWILLRSLLVKNQTKVHVHIFVCTLKKFGTLGVHNAMHVTIDWTSFHSVWRYVEKTPLENVVATVWFCWLFCIYKLSPTRIELSPFCSIAHACMAAISNLKMADICRGSKTQLTPIKFNSMSSCSSDSMDPKIYSLPYLRCFVTELWAGKKSKGQHLHANRTFHNHEWEISCKKLSFLVSLESYEQFDIYSACFNQGVFLTQKVQRSTTFSHFGPQLRYETSDIMANNTFSNHYDRTNKTWHAFQLDLSKFIFRSLFAICKREKMVTTQFTLGMLVRV